MADNLLSIITDQHIFVSIGEKKRAQVLKLLDEKKSTIIHNGVDGDALSEAIAAIWSRRDDRYSEVRSEETSALPRVEMSYIGG